MKKIFGLAAIAGLIVMAAPAQKASAVSLSNPGLATSVQTPAKTLTTDVQYRRHHHVRRPHHWQRPHHVRRHHGWHRPPMRHHRRY